MTAALSIVIPTRNRPQHLLALVAALQAQIGGRRDIELIICDEASTPPVKEQLQALGSIPYLTIVRNTQPQGPAAARNMAWQRASAPWIWFLDDDVLPAPQALVSMLKAITEAGPAIGIIEGAIALEQAPASILTHPLVKTLHAAGPEHRLTANIAYRTAALREVRGFDEKFLYSACEDFDLAYRVENKGWRHAFAAGALVQHAVHGLYRLPAYLRHRQQQRAASMRLFRKHPDRFGPAWIYKFGSRIHRRGQPPTTWTMFKFFAADTVAAIIAARRLWPNYKYMLLACLVHTANLLMLCFDFINNNRQQFRMPVWPSNLVQAQPKRHYLGLRPQDWLLAGAGATLGLFSARLLVVDAKLLIILLSGIIAFFITLRNPKYVLLGIFPFLLVEGAIRKWFLPGLQEILYLVKDGALLMVLAVWVVQSLSQPTQARGRKMSEFVVILFVINAIYYLLQLLNPAMPNLAFWVFGLKVYFLPLTLFFLMPHLLSSDDFRKLHKGLIFTLIPIGTLAVVQSQLPLDHPLNRYVWEIKSGIAFYGQFGKELARVTSTFSYISGFDAYLSILAFSIVSVFTREPKRYPTLIPVGFAAFALLCAVLTGSRRPVAYMLVGLPLSTLPLWTVVGTVKAIKRVLVAIGVGGILLTAFPEPIEQFRYRVEREQDVAQRVFGTFEDVIIVLEKGGLFGLGPAATHSSRDTLLKRTSDWAPYPGYIEREISKIFTELGLLGGVMWYAFKLTIVLMLGSWFIQARQAGDKIGEALYWAPLLFTTITFFTTTVMNPTLYYLWCAWIGGIRTYDFSNKRNNAAA